MTKRKADDAATEAPQAQQLKRSARRGYSVEQREKADAWIAELMTMADTESNKKGGAERFHAARQRVMDQCPACWLSAVKKVPFKANTKTVHGLACDRLIEAALRGAPPPDPAPAAAPAPAPASAAPVESVAPPVRPKGLKQPQLKAQRSCLERYFKPGSGVTESAALKAAPPRRPERCQGWSQGCPYVLLRVDPSASYRQLCSAYRSRALATHPDKPGGSAEAFRQLKEAFEFLADNEKRARYDAGLGRTRAECHEEEQGQPTVASALLANLLLRRLPQDTLKYLDPSVLKDVVQQLGDMRTRAPKPTTSGNLAEKDGSGLTRKRTGEWQVDVSWRSFRCRAEHISNLELATALHVAMVTMRSRAQARIEKAERGRRQPKASVEEPPLLEEELHEVMSEVPYMLVFASDLRRHWDDKEDQQDQEGQEVSGRKADRWMSPWTPSLQTALGFRRQLLQSLGHRKEVAFRAQDKKAQSDLANAEKSAFLKLQEDLELSATELLRTRGNLLAPRGNLRALEHQVERAARATLRAEQAEEKVDEHLLRLQDQKVHIQELEDDNGRLRDLVQETSQRYRNLKEEVKRKDEEREKIFTADKKCKQDLKAAKVVRTLAASRGRTSFN